MKILAALIKKEFLQIIRDPSSIIIAFVLPLISILIYMYGINLDSVSVRIGIKNDDANPEIETLLKSFGHSKYIKSIIYDNENDIEEGIIKSKLKGAVMIPNDFSKKLEREKTAEIIVITDGSETNTANYVQNYSIQIINNWLNTSKYKTLSQKPIVTSDLRVWYNEDLDSHYFILPGSIAVTMTLIGIMLTALVIAREWERGTMEALLSTPVKKIDIILGKYIPYFILGMLSMAFNVFMCCGVFQIPFRGNYLILFFVSSLFLFTSLGIGLIISTKMKNQFLASQVALGIGFLPSLLLSGLMFPINSMPVIFQYLTKVIPAGYFITFIESEFMAGTVWEVVIINSIFLGLLGSLLFIIVYKQTEMRLPE